MFSFRCALEAFHYMHARLTLDPNKLKTVHINMRRQMLKMVVHDLHIVWSLTESDQRLIRIGCEQLAYHSVKHAKRGHMTALQLSEVKKTIDGVGTSIADTCYIETAFYLTIFEKKSYRT